jgi:membrane associated rhomboid family serine protease
VPGRTLPCVWNLFTAGLVERQIAQLALSVVSLLVLAKIIEPVWGSKEFALFLAVVNLWSGLGTFVLLYILYAVQQNGQLLFSEYGGFHGNLAGLLVALKQVMPENEVTLFGFVKLKIKHLPVLYVVLSTVASAVLGGALNTVPFILFGAYAAWVYLRFFQQKPDLALKGDPSDEFRFASFFPEMVQPPIDAIAGSCSKTLRMAPQNSTIGPGAGNTLAGAASLPGSESADAARRRERGARALEERLSRQKAAAAAATTKAPDIENPPVPASAFASAAANGADQ